MKTRLIVLIGLTFQIFGLVKSAQATEYNYNTTIYAFAMGSESDANMIQVPFTIGPNCNAGGNARAYILRDDKQMFATALTAAVQRLTVVVTIETNAPPMNMHSSIPNPLRCKVVALIVTN